MVSANIKEKKPAVQSSWCSYVGYLADKFSVIIMLVFSLFAAGLVQAVAPAYSTYAGFVFFAVSYGFLSGSFVAMMPVIVAKYMGLAKFPQVQLLPFCFLVP